MDKTRNDQGPNWARPVLHKHAYRNTGNGWFRCACGDTLSYFDLVSNSRVTH